MLVWKVAPSPSFHLVLECLEIARFGRAGHAISWPAGPRHVRLGRESRGLVFRSRKSGNGNSWSRVSGHTKYESRCFGRTTSASVAMVATDHHGRKSLEMPCFGRQSLEMPNFGLESLDMPKFCRESLDMNLRPWPGKTARKTAEKSLKSCLKNRSKITARSERFLSGFLSKIWAVWAVFPKKTAQTAQILLENRSNRSYLERFLSGISTRVATDLLAGFEIEIFSFNFNWCKC